MGCDCGCGIRSANRLNLLGLYASILLVTTSNQALLRVSFFAQELRTPQPVSIKRLEKAWGQLNY